MFILLMIKHALVLRKKKTSMQASEMLGWGDSQCVAEGVV